jgi:MFS family permease
MSYVLTYAAHMWELFAMRSWMVAFLAFSLSLQSPDEGHWSPATIAALAALVAVGANVGGAELAIRFGRRRILTLIMWSSAIFAFGFGFTAALPYPVVAFLCVLYTMFVTADSGAIHTGAVLSAEPERRGATMAIQSLLGFAIASVAPLVIGVVLDATGSGGSVNSWGAAFIAMGVVVALGPIILALLGRETGGEI